MNYFILTGTSRGLGEALALRLISKDNYLFCISRTINEDLLEELLIEAKKKNSYIEYIKYDLNYLDGIDNLIKKIFEKINVLDAQSLTLINNAALLDPIKPINKCETPDIISNITVNTLAPMILTSQFMKFSENFKCTKEIINISSGAAEKAYFGWSCYCSSKASIDMFTKCVGLEQSINEKAVKIISFSPGIMDTDMQAKIRESKVEYFKDVEKFIKFKENGALKNADFVAQKLISILNNKKIENGSILDISDLI